MYYLINLYCYWWLRQYPRRSEKHFLVKKLTMECHKRSGFLMLLGLIVRLNTTGTVLSIGMNFWIAEKRDLYETGLLSWGEFKDCLKWQHMMN